MFVIVMSADVTLITDSVNNGSAYKKENDRNPDKATYNPKYSAYAHDFSPPFKVFLLLLKEIVILQSGY